VGALEEAARGRRGGAGHLHAGTFEVTRHAVQDHWEQGEQQRRVLGILREQLRHVEDELAALGARASAQAHGQLGHHRTILSELRRGSGCG